MSFKVYLRSENAKIPQRADEGCAGYDLFSSENKIIKAHSRDLVSTDISIQIPHETYARIAPRSGLSYKNSIDVGAGVADESYRGILKVLLINNSEKDFEVNLGDRIAQLIIEKCFYFNIEQVDSLDKLNSSVRGDGGFGSTGK
jgi:dUTP pyrophosphatase